MDTAVLIKHLIFVKLHLSLVSCLLYDLVTRVIGSWLKVNKSKIIFFCSFDKKKMILKSTCIVLEKYLKIQVLLKCTWVQVQVLFNFTKSTWVQVQVLLKGLTSTQVQVQVLTQLCLLVPFFTLWGYTSN